MPILFAALGCSSGTGVQMQANDFPAPAEGLQLTFGPFDVPAGQEVQLCQTFKLPNDQPLAIDRFQMRKSTGSHHTIIFTSDKDFPDQTFMCWGTVNFDDWNFLVDSQSEDFDWTLPAGKAYVLKPHQQVMIQAHYQNATHTQTPNGAYVRANLYATNMPAAADYAAVGHSIFTVNRRIDLPPHTTNVTFYRDCEFNRDAFLFGLYGHFHSRGRKFVVDHMGLPGSLGGSTNADDRAYIEPLYASQDWQEPPFVSSPSTALPGDGTNGVLIRQGESLRFTCTYDNDTDNEIVFGSHADVQEHCNLFVHYALAPSAHFGADPLVSCTNGAGGW